MAGEKSQLDIVAEATAVKAQLLGQKAVYKVISPAGVFKNGKLYKEGETLVMDKLTGGNQERAKAVVFVEDAK